MSKPTVKTKIILTSCSIIIFALFFYICAFMYPNQFEKYITVLFSFPIVVMTLFFSCTNSDKREFSNQ